jgi:hypothetical protein
VSSRSSSLGGDLSVAAARDDLGRHALDERGDVENT